MDSLDGFLMVPPDRGQILGRAVWKSRYVVVGRRGAREQNHMSKRPQPSRTTSQNAKLRASVHSGEYTLAIYKSKDDYEPSYQYPVSTISDCQVQQIAHRKQGPVLPTLVISIADKEKKRRSSRAAGFMPTKESTTTTLWFRTPPDDHHRSLHDWRQFILARKLPISPESPASPTFTNPFSGRGKEAAGDVQRSYKGAYARDRDAPGISTSESHSLRSKCSDISSPTSAAHPAFPHRSIPGQNYTTLLPTDIPADLPSPATSGSDEGAQARSASISSPRMAMERPDRRHASVSAGALSPVSRETILDRAFQMRCIPGSERAVPGEEKLSSLARFDALMRESEARRLKRVAEERAERQARRREEHSSGESTSEESEDESEDSDEYYLEQERVRSRRQTLIPPATQRALEFITGRNDRPNSPRTPRRATLDYDVDAFPMPPGTPAFRPHTSHGAKRPTMAQRTQSQPHLAPLHARAPPPLPTRVVEDDEEGTGAAPVRPGVGPKRVSFTEFARRLSSESSLLVMQGGGSRDGSRRGSSELEYQPVPPLPRGSVPRGGGAGEVRREEEKRCGWRGSVGVIGMEGGFF